MIKRVLVAILAVLLLAVGGVLGAAAIWTHDAFDDNGVMRTDAGTITPGPDARSTIIDVDRFTVTVPYIGELGTTKLSVSSGESADPSSTLFLGAAATADIDAFVKSSPYAVAIREGSEWTIREVPGTLIPPLPRDETFWLAQDVGRTPAISVPSERPLTLLVMHPAGVPTGPVTLSIDFTIPKAQQWALGFAIAAGVLIIIALVLLILVFRKRGRRGQHEAGVVVVDPAVVEPVVVGTVGTEPVAPALAEAAAVPIATSVVEPEDAAVVEAAVVEAAVVEASGVEPVVVAPVTDPAGDAPVDPVGEQLTLGEIVAAEPVVVIEQPLDETAELTAIDEPEDPSAGKHG